MMDSTGNISKAIIIIDSLKSNKNGLSLQYISDLTDISKTTTYRLCSILSKNGILYKDNVTKIYKLGPKFLEWIFAFKDHLDVHTEVENILHVISSKIGETATIFKRQYFERKCIYRSEADEKLRYSIKIGGRLPLNKGAGGKVILAFFEKEELDEYLKELKLDKVAELELLKQLKETKKKKFYVSYGERDPYVAAFSVPLFDIMKNNIIGSLSVSGPLDRFKKRFKIEYIEFVKSNALHIQTLMDLEGNNQV